MNFPHRRTHHRAFAAGLVLAACAGLPPARQAVAAGVEPSVPAPVSGSASACHRSFEMPGGGGALDYYASAPMACEPADAAPSVAPSTSSSPSARSTPPTPTRALVALHGHPRDALRTFDAASRAVRDAQAGAPEYAGDTLVVAPLFQVAADAAGRCDSPGNPAARPGDLLWTCASWMEGGRAANGTRPTSFAALDALIDELVRRWPGLRSITVAGFSAGAQMVQHYIGFAADRPPGTAAIRYVVASPGTWLYFDPVRPWPVTGDACPGFDDWKYGTSALPAALGRDAATARERYAAADIAYLAGERDDGDVPGAFYRILDKSCAAMAQGPSRLRRALAYASYDRELLAPGRQRTVAIVPGCAHDVACVFPAEAARSALLGRPER